MIYWRVKPKFRYAANFIQFRRAVDDGLEPETCSRCFVNVMSYAACQALRALYG
jgi:hypothetical protein